MQKLSYTYDLAGNITGIADATNANQTQTFGYDWLDRLTSAATSAVGVGQYSHTYQYNAIGNITSYNGNAYTYGSQPHAVTGAFGNSYGYDANGNQTSRIIAGTPYTQTFDYDNRLVGVAGSSVSATFVYDADGNRVKGTVAGVTTVYIAGLYEWQNGGVTKYYEGGAMRRTGYVSDNGVFYALSDQVKSTSVLVNQDGTVNSRNYYYPYGGNRGGAAFSGLTTKRFTGQYHEQSLPGGEGLSYYNARWYDGQLGVFISADTLVPSPLSPQSLNRYAYTAGNPLNYVDPSGHAQCRTREDCADIGETPMGRRPYQPGPPGISLASHHRNMASGAFGVKSGTARDAKNWLVLAGGALAMRNALPLATQNLRHYLERTGTSRRINVPEVLKRSESHARAVAALRGQLLSGIKNTLKDTEGKSASFDIHTMGTDQFRKVGSWQYTAMSKGKEDDDIYSAYNGIDWQITAHVSARRVGQQWQTTVAMRVWAVDPYDWEPYDVVTGANVVMTPAGISQEEIGNLHKVGLAREYLAIGWMDVTSNYFFP